VDEGPGHSEDQFPVVADDQIDRSVLPTSTIPRRRCPTGVGEMMCRVTAGCRPRSGFAAREALFRGQQQVDVPR
jgi:hypothetical protein